MKKILSLFFGFLCIFAANAAQVANVEYVHTLIEQEWDISIPYNSALSDVHTVANMKYLLTAIDVANEILNGEKTTDYGNSEFATLQAADTVATNAAVEKLIKKEIEYEFFLTTTSTNSFSFSISAAGEFVVDWGDGTVETITKSDTTNTIYSHNYDTAGAYTISIGGQATVYNTSTNTAAISFIDARDWEFDSTWQIASINGSLGAIFGTLPDATEKQPRFYQTFSYATKMEGTIPENLFAGIYGAPASYMFYNTFHGCRGLTSIPAGLFAGISGEPASSMFNGTFSECGGLTGTIPAGLFANLSGEPASSMFDSTFWGCNGLTGAIPAGLFAGISGEPASSMFSHTFSGCSGLTSIPENLFGNISGTAQTYMFNNTFSNCTSLTGPSARINGQYLYEIWPDTTEARDMYYNATGLFDYSNIPSAWK